MPGSRKLPRSWTSYHAREHIHDLARLLELMLLDRKDEWLAARLEDLDYGSIDGIVAAARKSPSPQSSRQACTGPSAEPTLSSPCAARKPAAPGKPSAASPTLRRAPPNGQAPLEDDLYYLQN
jgi:hypothetical protein